MSSNVKVLVIDDCDIDRTFVARVLERKGFIPLTLASAESALDVIEQERPSAVLLDIMMPGTSGRELLSSIRDRWSPLELSVIMISSRSEADDVVECLAAGANDYITKPFDVGITLMRVETHVKIATLSREMARLQQMEALCAMITTYNHEINNPLTIALCSLRQAMKQSGRTKDCERIETALLRIAEIVKKIDAVAVGDNIDYASYADMSKMVKI